ncbi:MAG: DUF814 domain-containing protein [Ignavibacteria bacterium]|nr:MAG: DUF814 domain-containing protein [Ignavibacteria bacterium]
MFRNYLYLFRLAGELKQLIDGAEIIDSYSQEKDKLFLQIPGNTNEYRTLILDTSSLFNFAFIKDEHHKAKKNTIQFCDDFLPAKITDVLIADDDRVIKIITSSGELYFTVWGGISNVVWIKDEKVESFKKIKKENYISQLLKLEFIDPSQNFMIDYFQLTPPEIKEKYFFVRKDIYNELLHRTELGINSFEATKDIIHEILDGKISISKLSENEFKLHPDDFLIFKNSIHIKSFDSVIEAVNNFRSIYFSEKNKNERLNKLSIYLNKELDNLSRKMNKLRQRIDAGSREKEYKNYADLLAANLNNLVPGSDSVILEDFYTGEKIKIALDKKLSPQKNIDKYYEKSRDERISFEKSSQLFDEINLKYQKLIEIKNKLQDISYDELNELYMKFVGEKSKMDNKTEGIKFKHYIAENKYHIYVGKDNKNNDLLTFKFAKQNDYWFHVRGYSGSHVVLKVDNAKQGMPKNIIKSAASLAAYHSKAKTAGVVPVIYTFRKYVHKKKGMAPGQVAVQRENSVIVPPEIPSNCEFVTD